MSKRRPRLIDYRRRWLPQTRTGRTEALLVVFILLLPLLAANRATLDLARERYNLLDFDAFAELLHSFSRLDITADLHKISAPTLVIVGDIDRLEGSDDEEGSTVFARPKSSTLA